MTHEQIIGEILKKSKEDTIGFWWIVSYGASDTGIYDDPEPLSPLPITDPIEVKAKTLSLVRDLLNTRRLQAGDLPYGEIAVKPWRVSVEAVVDRIDREWTELGKEPSLDFPVGLGECTPETWPHGG